MANKTKQINTAQLRILIWFFIRQYEIKHNNYVPVPLKCLILKFSNKIIGCNMLTLKEDIQLYQLLHHQLKTDYKISITKPLNFLMLYRASDNNFTSESFHKFCDNHAGTIVIIKSNYGNIFGGYTSIPWSSPSVDDCMNLSVTAFDEKSFLFTIRDRSESSHINYIPKLHLPESLLCGSVTLCRDLGPTFGHDIQIVKQCNDNHRHYFQNYTSQFSYKHDGRICGASAAATETNHDNMYQYGTANKRRVYFFSVIDYEVFKIV